jgi:hypothetical protein
MTPESRAGVSDLAGLIDAPENRPVTSHGLQQKQPLHAIPMATNYSSRYILIQIAQHTYSCNRQDGTSPVPFGGDDT